LTNVEFCGGVCIVSYVNLVVVHSVTHNYISQKWFSIQNFVIEINYGCH
jgi:hypothetical protein